jgi:hypothetical protein
LRRVPAIRLAIAALAACLVLAAPARATDYVVNTNVDPVSPDLTCAPEPGGCPLRDALDDAGPGDRVIVPANTYSLAQNGPLNPVNDTIVGAGARTTIIDAGGVPKVIEVANTPGGVVSGVTLRNGGGQSQLSGAGGAVLVASSFAPASLTLRNVTVTASQATAGGGVASVGATLTVENSTITGNRAATAQGTQGGGVVVSGGTTTIRNSTISGNTAVDVDTGTPNAGGGGVWVESGTLVTQNVTIAGNVADTGTGLYGNVTGNPTITLTNTLIADTCVGAPFGGSRNLSTSATCFGTAVNPLLGPLANNGGQTDTRALAAGSPAINAGASCPTTDQRGVAREGACDVGAYEYRTPPPPPDDELPPPVPHKNVNAFPKSGTVKIKLPGTDKFVTLTEGQQIPLGTTVDTRKGRVTIVAAAGDGQTADFYDGVFKLSQTKGKKPITVLTLVEKLTGCTTKKQASAAAKKKSRRRLWGNGKGRFRTKGKHSAATVVGTKWLVEDRCTSTLTKVKRGKVKVRDFVRHKTVTVKAGKRYIARKRG